MVNKLFQAMASEDEKKSWEVKSSKSYRLNVVIDGLELNREFPAVDEKDRFYQGTGKTDTEVMAMVAKAKKKGLQPTLYITESVSRRLV
jgi:preprotein translocase subunit SecA